MEARSKFEIEIFDVGRSLRRVPNKSKFLIEEFDSGSEQTLAACLIHASRTRKYLRVLY